VHLGHTEAEIRPALLQVAQAAAAEDDADMMAEFKAAQEEAERQQMEEEYALERELEGGPTPERPRALARPAWSIGHTATPPAPAGSGDDRGNAPGERLAEAAEAGGGDTNGEIEGDAEYIGGGIGTADDGGASVGGASGAGEDGGEASSGAESGGADGGDGANDGRL